MRLATLPHPAGLVPPAPAADLAVDPAVGGAALHPGEELDEEAGAFLRQLSRIQPAKVGAPVGRVPTQPEAHLPRGSHPLHLPGSRFSGDGVGILVL